MKAKRDAEVVRQAHTFSDPESFGLFMEALRDLQIYTDYSAQAQPDNVRLSEHLDCAVEVLEKCHQDFPGDLLPSYYLAIVLTMKNQRVYAQLMLDQISKTSSLGVAPAVPSLLAARAWPLLDRAASLFRQVMQIGYGDLAKAAKFNLAHVYAKRDGDSDLKEALALLSSVPGPRADYALPSLFRRGWSFVGGSDGRQAGSRTFQEAIALSLQAQTLTCAIEARIAMKAGGKEEFGSAVGQLNLVRKQIEIAELEPGTVHDLLADSWTKSGFISYSHAATGSLQDSGRKADLAAAEIDLGRALEYKPFWIPAQTYLALVYVAQGRNVEAREQLESVLGVAQADSA